MTTQPTLLSETQTDYRGALPCWGPLLAALLLAATGLAHADERATLTGGIVPTIEGDRFALRWSGQPGARYRVQARASLSDTDGWKTLDLMHAATNTGPVRWTAPEDVGPQRFYRLAGPDAEIFSIEPAIAPPNVPVTLYVLGQCFQSNDVLRVGGVVHGGAILSAAVSSVGLAAQPPGWQRVELVRDGLVLSFFDVFFGDASTAPELVLQGPPEAPPASPDSRLKSKTKSNQSNDRFAGNGGAQAPAVFGWLDAPIRSTSSCGVGGGGIRENDAVTFDVQEGKKGLNAVNVKLARMSGGGDDPVIYPGAPDKCGDAVLQSCGEVQLGAADLVIPGRGLDFAWVRTYRSRTGPSTAQGHGWDFSYNVSLTAESDGSVVLRPGNGRVDVFYPNTTGGWSRPEYFVEIGDLDADGFPDVVTFADSGKWVFNSLLGTTAPGKLAQIIDRNGNTMKLHYDGSGQLIEVVDDLDRTNAVAYQLTGQIASVTDFSGRTVRYEYDSNSNLVTCISPVVTGTPNGNDFPGGKTNRYTYSSGYINELENHLLLSVMDAAGQIVSQFIYQHNQTDLEFLRCIARQRGSSTPTRFTYLPQTPTPANQFAAMRCIVNDPEGNVTKLYFDARNRRITMESVTGRATPGVPVTETVNQPTGKLRPSDPDSYVTRWQWNNDSLCTLETLPGGQKLQCIYESDFDASTPARKRADCRVVREIASSPVDVDGDGVADMTERTWRYEYDPRFGSSSTARNRDWCWRTRSDDGIKDVQVGEVCDDSNTTSGDGCNSDNKVNQTAGEQCDNGVGKPVRDWIKPSFSQQNSFATSATDPRGNVTTGSYDAKGNPTHIQISVSACGASAPVIEFAYNNHGQVTAITNLPDANCFRRVDTFSYYPNGPQAGCLLDWKIDVSTPDTTSTTGPCEYDLRGNLTRYVDPRTNDWLYSYNALDQLVRCQTPTNLTARCTTDFSYDANDNLVQSTTELRDAADILVGARVNRASYDSRPRLTHCVSAVDATHSLTNQFVYDGNGQCVQMLGGDAVSGADKFQKISFEYDERGLPFREIAAPGSADQSTTQYDYDANGNVIRVTEGWEGTPRTTTLEYDGFTSLGVGATAVGQVFTQPARRTKSEVVLMDIKENFAELQIRGGGNPIPHFPYPTKEDKGNDFQIPWKGRGKTMAHDDWDTGMSRLSKITDPMGNQTTFNYDANDNLKVFRHFGQTNDVPGTNGNVRLAETRCDYDAVNLRIRARDAFFDIFTQAPIGDGERTTTFSNAPNGQLVSVTDDLGRVTRFGYDTAGRAVSTTDARHNVVIIAQDACGNITSRTSTELPDLGGPPQVFARTNVYDSLNRLVRSTDNVGNTNRYAYDSLNRLTVMFNPREYTRTFAYDLLDRGTLTVTDLDGDGTASLTADVTATATWSSSSARLLSTTDSHTNTTSYGYDSLGRCTSVTNADGTRHTFVWNAHSDLVSEQDANGTVTLHTYDLNDRCTANQYTPGAGVSATTTFEQFAYDGLSRLVAARNNGSVSTFAYDSLGNRTRDAAGAFAAVSTFDSVGNRLALTYPGGRVVTCAYDELDRCTGVFESGKSLATFAYAGPGRLARTTCVNGVRTDVDWNGLVTPSNAPGDFGWQQVSRVNHTRAGDGLLVAERTLKHDRNQNTISVGRAPATIVPGETITLAYDPTDRLVDSMVTSNSTLVGFATYGLDRMGNRTNISRPFCAGNYSLDATLPPGDFQMNQYTATPCDTRAYDANGNLTSTSTDPTSSVNYTYDCLDRLVAVTNSGTPVATYAYDALGRRISKSVASVGLSAVRFLYDGESVIEERSGDTVTATYVRRPRCFGAGQPQHKTCDQMRRAGQDYYFHTDDLGNVLALTDAKGAVVERYDYEDYGAVTFLDPNGALLTGSDGLPATSSAVGNPFLFRGMEWDSETGLYLQRSGVPVVEWTFEKGWPVRWEMSELYDPQTASAIRGKVKIVKIDTNSRGVGGGNNPWSGGSGSPSAMQKGTVKFFNEAKGFGRISGGSGGAASAVAFDGFPVRYAFPR